MQTRRRRIFFEVSATVTSINGENACEPTAGVRPCATVSRRGSPQRGPSRGVADAKDAVESGHEQRPVHLAGANDCRRVGQSQALGRGDQHTEAGRIDEAAGGEIDDDAFGRGDVEVGQRRVELGSSVEIDLAAHGDHDLPIMGVCGSNLELRLVGHLRLVDSPGARLTKSHARLAGGVILARVSEGSASRITLNA